MGRPSRLTCERVASTPHESGEGRRTLIRDAWHNRIGVVHLPLTIEIRSSGWEDPGCIGGPPEDCREPEGDEERVITSIDLGELVVNGFHYPALFHRLIDELQEQVDEADVDWEDAS